jgi:hypothetical protein
MAADAFGGQSTPAAAGIISMYGLRRHRIGGLQNSALWGLRDGSLGQVLWRGSHWCCAGGGRAMVVVLGDPCSHLTDFGELKVDGIRGRREFQSVPDDVIFVGVCR